MLIRPFTDATCSGTALERSSDVFRILLRGPFIKGAQKRYWKDMANRVKWGFRYIWIYKTIVCVCVLRISIFWISLFWIINFARKHYIFCVISHIHLKVPARYTNWIDVYFQAGHTHRFDIKCCLLKDYFRMLVRISCQLFSSDWKLFHFERCNYFVSTFIFSSFDCPNSQFRLPRTVQQLGFIVINHYSWWITFKWSGISYSKSVRDRFFIQWNKILFA